MDEENSVMEETSVIEDSSDVEFVCGDPQVEPRVGDEYQVEIPHRMSASKRAKFRSAPIALDDCFLVGLPVPVTWIDKLRKGQENGDDNVDMSQSLRSFKAKKSRYRGKIRGESDKNSKYKRQRLNLEAVPALPSSSWEAFEVDSFVLGLYTFGKNFTQVKTFMENKGTGEILLFYYGEFYNSAKYHSWSESRKKRNRKCVNGRKLYSGWRQHQLLSRLIPSISDESQKQMLVNVSKSFAEGNMTLEKYVTEVKDLVGLKLLVDAVAIGKGKEDLTVVTSVPMKTKTWFTVSTKPSPVQGFKASSLTSVDIINQLTGSSRLSKARCNDIFWEAVWPRLLARGWHSEQPKDRGYFTSKDNIVFMVPGVKNFVRGELVKGDHYFDSVSDILTKVASEPELLEFETGGEIREAAANGLDDAENSSDQSDEEPNSQRHRYLRSPCSNRGSLQMKFTVVDTSLVAGGKLCDLRSFNAESLVSEAKTRLGDKNSSVLGNYLHSQNVEKSQMMPLEIKNQVNDPINVEKSQVIPLEAKNQVDDPMNVEKSQVIPLEAKNKVDDPMRFTIIDTSLDHREKLSGFRRWRQLPVDDTEKDYVRDDSIIEVEETLEKIKDSSKKHKFNQRAETNYRSAPLLKRRRISTCVRSEKSRSRESPVFKHLQGDDTEKMSLESNHLNLFAVQEQHSTPEEMNQDKQRHETDQSEKTGTGSPPSHVENQVKSEIEPNGLKFVSGVDNKCCGEEKRTKQPQELPLSEQESNRLCSVSDSGKKCYGEEKRTRQDQELPSSEQESKRLCSVSDSDKRCSSNDPENIQQQEQAVKPPSINLGTTQELGSSEQQQHDQQVTTDGPRRLSTRKRPLTTRALEALETGFLTTKRMKSTTRPRKRESSTRNKQSIKTCNRVQSVPDNGSTDLKHRGEDRSIFVKKEPASKPLDQIEDSKPSFPLDETRTESKAKALDRTHHSKPSFLLHETRIESKALDRIQDSKPVLTEYPKLPPIVFKFPFKRG